MSEFERVQRCWRVSALGINIAKLNVTQTTGPGEHIKNIEHVLIPTADLPPVVVRVHLCSDQHLNIWVNVVTDA
mgnify:CR=1 FL=1